MHQITPDHLVALHLTVTHGMCHPMFSLWKIPGNPGRGHEATDQSFQNTLAHQVSLVGNHHVGVPGENTDSQSFLGNITSSPVHNEQKGLKA